MTGLRAIRTILIAASLLASHTELFAQPAPTPDKSPHKTVFVAVQPDVKLEVLDWGGNGTPLIFLAGLGDTAHVFDSFGPKFTDKHHVIAITRRGFGSSTSPPNTDANYDADRLGNDVLAIIDTLKLNRPFVAGHSLAGEELSSIGTRHPEKVAGLIYLDAIYQYSFYDPSVADLSVETATVKRDLAQMFDFQNDPAGMRALIAEVQGALPNLQKALADAAEATASMPATAPQSSQDLAGNRVFDNTRRYGIVTAPVLAIVAEPRQCLRNCDAPFMKTILAADSTRYAHYEEQNPKAHFVRLPNASHYLWRSNEADVLREMNAFMDAQHGN